MASPHAAASSPLSESPVNRRRAARWTPIRWAQTAVVGDPQTRAGG